MGEDGWVSETLCIQITGMGRDRAGRLALAIGLLVSEADNHIAPEPAERRPRMRVANIIEEGRLGGPQFRMLRVAEVLAKDIDTTLIMPLENSERFQEECAAREVDYKARNISRITKDWRVALRYALFSVFEVVALARTISSGNYNIVHVSGGSWQYKGLIAAKLAGVPVVWHLNDTSMPRLFRWIFAALNPLADGFIFASERSRQYYQGLIKRKKPEFLVPAPVDTGLFSPDELFEGEESTLAQWRGKTVIGVVANVNPVKGLETFIRMAARVNQDCSAVQFVVVGAIHPNQKSYYERLQRLASELRVDNLEFLEGRTDVRPLLQRFDVYVCSSMAESSPMAVWEAMSMARPVVSTDVGDVPLFVKENESGVIVPVGDDSAMAAAVSSLVASPEQRKRLGENARQVAIEQLDISNCAALHYAAYAEILRARQDGY